MGTSGLVLPYKNRQAYPAAFEGRSRLGVYGALFNSIEINSIFYKLPKPSTVAQWSASVGDEFRFTFKLWKQITHNKGLDFERTDIEKFFGTIAGAGDKKGCVLVQFPASIKVSSFEKLERMLSCIQDYNKGQWPLALEFRSDSWYTAPVYQLLNVYGATMVYHDKAGSNSPQPELDAGHIYLRFHGPDGNYKGSYDQGLLYEYAGYIAEWAGAGKIVYVYFNNTMGNAVDNLRTLDKFLKDDYPAL